MAPWTEPDGPTPEQEAAWDYNTLRDQYSLLAAHAEQAVEGIKEAGRVMPVRADHRDLQASAECRSRLIAALLMTMAAILERKDNDR